MKVLILGGTSDAIKLCQLALQHHEVIYSIKGLVRQPQLSCKVRTGGFGGVQGLIGFLRQQKIDSLLDATHPYAINISHHAKLAASYCHIPCFHYIRPAWQQQWNDHWILFENRIQLIEYIESSSHSRSRFLFTIGQLSSEFFAKKKPQHGYIIRSAIENKIQEQDGIRWIKSRGPFAIEDERKLFDDYKIDALISKNSGGDSVAAKIYVAREMMLPVYMLQRPEFKSDYPVFSSINAILSASL